MKILTTTAKALAPVIRTTPTDRNVPSNRKLSIIRCSARTKRSSVARDRRGWLSQETTRKKERPERLLPTTCMRLNDPLTIFRRFEVFATVAFLLAAMTGIGLAAGINPDQSRIAATTPIQPQSTGVLQLDAGTATVHGKIAKFQVINGVSTICCWTDASEYVSWPAAFAAEGEYVVEMNYSCPAGEQGSTFDITLGNQKLTASVSKDTGTWNNYRIAKLGYLKVTPSNLQTLTLKPVKKSGTGVMNLVWLRLIPTNDYANYVARTANEHAPAPVALPAQVFIVPNYHPASCGWLGNWSLARIYCANSYLKHLDRVRDDANYDFAMSECNNMIAIENFQPDRFIELKQRIAQGRVELVNAFFLEPTINLSGGEALAKMGIEGLRWQQQVMGVRPRYCWMIDECGTHAQMPQICDLLGLDALIYTRCNRSGKSAFWSESPDSSRILTMVPGEYSENIGGNWTAREALTEAQLHQVANAISSKLSETPTGAPVLSLGGYRDYSLPPAGPRNPTEFLQQWRQFRPDCDIRYTGLSPYVDALLLGVNSGKIKLPTVHSGTSYSFNSFWIENPLVKTRFRSDEHALESAETLATIASLKAGFEYPMQSLYHAWLQMFLNMDRNTLWGSAVDLVFEDPTSWDAKDRFEWVEKHSAETLEAAARQLTGNGSSISLFNSANWKRTDPLRLQLPANTTLAEGTCESAGDGTTFCQVDVPATGLAGVALKPQAATAPQVIPLPETIDTKFYSAKIDPATGALVSLKSKPSGREMLGGPANVLVAEKHTGSGKPGDDTNARAMRPRLASSGDFKTIVTATEGPLAITVEADGTFFGGGACKRVTRFFKDHPRIEFETDLNDIPDLTVVVAEFPLAKAPAEIRRGIPFGFSRDDEAAISGIVPAVQWSDYSSAGKGGVTLLDRGLSGREIDGSTPVIYLLNAMDQYSGLPSTWLSGKGSHHFEYALMAHETDWTTSRIPQLAWEYNCPVTVATGCQIVKPVSFLKTSDNVIVEALRRDGPDIEMRLVECLGMAGEAEVKLDLPYEQVAMTDLTGGHAQKLDGGPDHRFPVRPQQIVTLRFRTAAPVAEIKPLLDWSELVPADKLAALHNYISTDAYGTPPPGK
jgi:alpha-mannosidase